MAFAKPEVRDLYAEQDRWKRRIYARLVARGFRQRAQDPRGEEGPGVGPGLLEVSVLGMHAACSMWLHRCLERDREASKAHI